MRFIVLIIFSLLSKEIVGQTQSYTTIKIANWTLEKFPKHYLIKAVKVYTEKDKFTGKLTYYQELNQYGKVEGLTVEVQKDLSSPHAVYYYRNGVVVYRASFFRRSSKANEIANKNLKEDKDGPQVKRNFSYDEKLQELIDVYKDGELVKTNRPDNSPKMNWVDGLLDGDFRYTNERYQIDYQGKAKEGKLLYLKSTNRVL